MPKLLTQDEVKERIKNTYVQDVELYSEYVSKRVPITLHCKDCGHIWEVNTQGAISPGRHVCPNCTRLAQTTIQKCAYCGKEIMRSPYQVERNKSGFFYCSKECGNRHKNLIRLENGEFDNSQNYRLKALLTYDHKCCVCGWKEDERILEVHHIDENRQNNNIENLAILCPICHRKITLKYYEFDSINHKLIEK